MKKAIVVINEGHEVLEDQERLLRDAGYEYSLHKIPADGLTLQRMQEVVNGFPAWSKIIFISPAPTMMAILNSKQKRFKVLHNDQRVKRELPNGKIIMTVAETGWQLV